MYSAMKRLQIQTLARSGGLPAKEVAERTEVSESTVRRISEEEPVQDPQATEAERSRRMGRPSTLEGFRGDVESWLKEDPSVGSGVLLERLRHEGCATKKSAVYDFIRKLRPPKAEGVARFEGVAGEFSQHDFGQFRLKYTDTGETEVVHFFASRLKYSRLSRVLLLPDEKLERLCFALVDAFNFFGGLPLISVFDNPKTLVIKHERPDPVWNQTFAQFAAEIDMTPMAHWPRRPQEKGSVENLVGFVKSNFFKVHKFRNRADLEEKLETWHRETNDERPSRATGEIPRVRFLLEEPRLKESRIPEDGYALRHTRVVRTDGYCEFNGLRYFAGLGYVGRSLTVRVSRDQVAIFAGADLLARHPRQPLNGQYSVLRQQRHELLGKAGARPYSKRQLLMDLCPAAEWFVTELRHRRPDTWKVDIDEAYDLLERFGDEALRDALITSSRQQTVGAEYLEAILRGHAKAGEVTS
jgi:transposase